MKPHLFHRDRRSGQPDLVLMQGLSRDNMEHKKIMPVIADFCKRAWAIPIKNKSGNEMLAAFPRLLKEDQTRKPGRLLIDLGKEMLNIEGQGFLKCEGLHISSQTAIRKRLWWGDVTGRSSPGYVHRSPPTRHLTPSTFSRSYGSLKQLPQHQPVSPNPSQKE